MNDSVVSFAVGTTLPRLYVTLQTEDGSALNLTGATSVILVLTDPRSGVSLSKTGTVVIPTDGVVSVAITADITDDPIEWLSRYRVTYPTGIVDVPNAGYLRVRVS